MDKETENWKLYLLCIIGLAAVHAAFIYKDLNVKIMWCNIAWTCLLVGFMTSAIAHFFYAKKENFAAVTLSLAGNLLDISAGVCFLVALWRV